MDDHSRTIIHIDIDCFYAQVEMIKQPHLRDQPLGIQQKNIVVTSNYNARAYGIKKCMTISDAKKLCPNLILVKGEDLYDYRQVSSKVSELLREYSELVEKLGLDENFVDVTELINDKLVGAGVDTKSVGNIFGDKNTVACDCGCLERISIASQIAQHMRDNIFDKLHLTTCAGVAHNKLLAKIVGTKNKPNNQTLVYPNSASELMLSLEDVKNIPWIGHVSAEHLHKININKVADLQNCSSQLQTIFDSEKARNLINLSFGIDNTPVKKSGKPLSIGIEDACKPLTSERDVDQKVKELFKRLLILVKEDGRIPKVLKITVGKFAKPQPIGGFRETRQCTINIPISNEDQLTNVALGLFSKIVDKSKAFKITLLGLSFSKFINKPSDKNTLDSFLSKGMKESSSLSLVEESPKVKYSSDSSSILEPAPKRSKFSDTACFGACSTFSSEPIESNVRDNSGKVEAKLAEEIKCPPGIDKDVFMELPSDVQIELWNDYKIKQDRDKQTHLQRSCKKTNTLFNYVVRQPKK